MWDNSISYILVAVARMLIGTAAFTLESVQILFYDGRDVGGLVLFS